MQPVVQVGDFVVADKFAHACGRTPQRRDLVAFCPVGEPVRVILKPSSGRRHSAQMGVLEWVARVGIIGKRAHRIDHGAPLAVAMARSRKL